MDGERFDMIKTQDKLAFDYKSSRVYDVDGHLHVAQTNISKANVCPYYGHEIPDADRLGLDPHRIYHLLRDPSELAKAAASFNGKPLLLGHNPVSAQDHDHGRTVGAISNVRWVPPHLKADLSCWAGMAIDGIEDRSVKELSASYRYRADMRPGTFQGQRYDGVMRDITANHVALVEKGRAGSDVVVGDSALVPHPHLDSIRSAVHEATKGLATYQDLAQSLVKNGLSPDSVRRIIGEMSSGAAMDAAGNFGDTEMNPTELETIVKFLMEQLPEDKLAELDAKLSGEDRASGIAVDSSLRAKRDWLAMDARARHAVRKGRGAADAQRAADAARREQMFPNMNRLGSAL